MTDLHLRYYWDKEKTTYKGAVLLFKIGSWYQSFFDDAKLISHKCGLDIQNDTAFVSKAILNDVILEIQLSGYEVQIVTERKP